MPPRVWVRSVEVETEQMCVATGGQGPSCDEHDHLPGARRLRVDLEPEHGSATEAEWQAMVGRAFDLC